MSNTESNTPKMYTQVEVDALIAKEGEKFAATIKSTKEDTVKEVTTLADTYKSMGVMSHLSKKMDEQVEEMLKTVTDVANKADLTTFKTEFEENKKKDPNYPLVSEMTYKLTEKTIQNEQLKSKRAADTTAESDAASKKTKTDTNPVIPGGAPPDDSKKSEKALGLMSQHNSAVLELKKEVSDIISKTISVSSVNPVTNVMQTGAWKSTTLKVN